MKKTIYFALVFGFGDVVLATSCQIKLERSPEQRGINIRCNDLTRNVPANDIFKIGNSALGYWNGKNFFLMSGNDKVSEDLRISSEEIPVVLKSVVSSGKCKVCAPQVSVVGDTRINKLSVDVGNEDAALGIDGSLTAGSVSVRGSAIIQKNGSVNILDKGILKLKSMGSDSLLEINGILSSDGNLTVDTTKCFDMNIVNNGKISARNVTFSTGNFLNEKSGTIIGHNSIFYIDGNFYNRGILEFHNFSVARQKGADEVAWMSTNFVQNGVCCVYNRAKLGCNVEICGQTQMEYLAMPRLSTMKITGGSTSFHTILGPISRLTVTGASLLSIDKMKGGADFVDSVNSKITIDKFASERRSVFSVGAGGNIEVMDARSPEGYMFAMENGKLKFSKFEGEAKISATDKSNIQVENASQISYLSTEQASVAIKGSFVGKAYCLDGTKSIIKDTDVESMYNKADVEVEDSAVKGVRNDGVVKYSGDTLTCKLINRNEAIYGDGQHTVGTYFGGMGDAKLVVSGTETANLYPIISDASAVFQGGKASVAVDDLAGMGVIRADQHKYDGFLPKSFHTEGNVDVITKCLPKPEEMPSHSDGNFRLTVDMGEDFINTEDLDYKDVLLFLDMHGHQWKNRNARFYAGGLQVDGASIFENHNGVIGLERMLDVHAWQIVNSATPIAKDNGRWVDDRSNWRARLVYYCPATYYSAKPESESAIWVQDGDVILKSGDKIINSFSHIQAGGLFTASANESFENVVSSITAFGNGVSTIEAKNISNRCLSTYKRHGEAHAKGRCGWGFGRHTWYADSYTAEWVTQSPGSIISVGGDLNLKGKTENVGSKISAKRTVKTDVRMETVLENKSVIEAEGVVVASDDVKCSYPFIFVHNDSME